MKMRITALLLTLCMILAVAASCGSDKESGGNKTTTSAVTTTTDAQTTTTQAPTTETQAVISDETESVEKGENSKEYTPLNYKVMKAVWVSQFDSQGIFKLDSENTFKIRVKKLLKSVIENGFNTVILQVRPNGDSYYPSEFYPESKFLHGGTYGWEKEFDPFAIFIELAHEVNVSVHAWINPLRLMSSDEIDRIPEKFLIRQWYDDEEKNGKYVVEVTANNTALLYLNPAYEETRKLIIDGAAEICRKYNVDGLQMDDYFYPTQAKSFDADAFAEASKEAGLITLANWRRGNINSLVKGIYSTVKSIDSRIPFGISPAGNIDGNINGLYADVKKWCSEGGFVDYIAPQLYWSFNDTYAKFRNVYNSWRLLMRNDNVKLYVGLALYKAGEDGEWATQSDIIKREIEVIMADERCSGAMIFSYQNVISDDSAMEAEVGNFVDTLKNWK